MRLIINSYLFREHYHVEVDTVRNRSWRERFTEWPWTPWQPYKIGYEIWKCLDYENSADTQGFKTKMTIESHRT